MGPSLVGLSAAVNSKIVCCSKQWCCLNSTRTLPGADLALQDTGALAAAAAQYGRLGVLKHSPLFQGWTPPLSLLDGALVLVLHLER